MTGRVVVVGSVNEDHIVRADRLPRPGETLSATAMIRGAGGKGANQAVAAAREGAAVRLVAAVGADAAGDALVAGLAQRGVDVGGVRRSVDLPTGAAVVTVAATGENTILVVPGANAALAAEDVPLADLVAGDVVLTQLEAPETVVRALAVSAGPWRLVVNASPLSDDDGALRALWAEVLHVADPLIVNRDEAVRLLSLVGDPVGSDASLAPALSAAGAPSAVVTVGADGAWWSSAGTCRHVPAIAARVVDTTGAGDAFAGALAAGLAAGRALDDVLDGAARAAAEVVSRIGAQESPPSGPDRTTRAVRADGRTA